MASTTNTYLSSHRVRKPAVFVRKNDISFQPSLSSFKTPSIPGNDEYFDRDESVRSAPTIDPRFMRIEKDVSSSVPTNPSPPIDVKVENWLHGNEVSKQDLIKKIKASTVVTDKRKQKSQTPAVQSLRTPFFRNLKRLHSAKTSSRNDGRSNTGSPAASRTCVSNPEVSSTNEDSPRVRKLTLREKLRSLHTPLPSSNRQTFDMHYAECDSDECCLKRNCSKSLKDSVCMVNLCRGHKESLHIRKTPADPLMTDEEPGDHKHRLRSSMSKCVIRANDTIGDGLDRASLLEEKFNLMRINQELGHFCKSQRSSINTPVSRLFCFLIVFIVILLFMLSVFYDINIVQRFYASTKLWIETHNVISMRRKRSPTKWELSIKVCKAIYTKFVGVLLPMEWSDIF